MSCVVLHLILQCTIEKIKSCIRFYAPHSRFISEEIRRERNERREMLAGGFIWTILPIIVGIVLRLVTYC